jgi:hypothetical protein
MASSVIDVWSSRVANFSQIGLLGLAVFGYVYTVIPVYQKSLLDEDIAKKTLEIEKKDQKITEINSLLLSKSKELEVVSQEIETARKEAEDSKRNFAVMRNKFSQQYAELRVHLLGQFMTIGSNNCKLGSPPFNELSSCLLTNVVNSDNLKDLNKSDKNKLKLAIKSEIPNITLGYNELLNEQQKNSLESANNIKKAEDDCQSQKKEERYIHDKASIDIQCDYNIKIISINNLSKTYSLDLRKFNILSNYLNKVASKVANTL